MQTKIESILTRNIAPTKLEVVNESAKHNVPAGSESHFKVTAVSAKFNNLTKVARHKLIYNILETELKSIHALSLALYTPNEWQQNPDKIHITPPCSKKGN